MTVASNLRVLLIVARKCSRGRAATPQTTGLFVLMLGLSGCLQHIDIVNVDPGTICKAYNYSIPDNIAAQHALSGGSIGQLVFGGGPGGPIAYSPYGSPGTFSRPGAFKFVPATGSEPRNRIVGTIEGNDFGDWSLYLTGAFLGRQRAQSGNTFIMTAHLNIPAPSIIDVHSQVRGNVVLASAGQDLQVDFTVAPACVYQVRVVSEYGDVEVPASVSTGPGGKGKFEISGRGRPRERPYGVRILIVSNAPAHTAVKAQIVGSVK